MFLKLKCIAICLVLILTLNLAACLFVPETKAIKNNDCQLVTKKWSLEFKKADISGRVDGEILVAIGAVAVGSLVVSGSVVVVGNTIHWLEQQGLCDDSITQKTDEGFVSGLKSTGGYVVSTSEELLDWLNSPLSVDIDDDADIDDDKNNGLQIRSKMKENTDIY